MTDGPHPRLSRRAVLQAGIGAAALALTGAACSSDPDPDPDPDDRPDDRPADDPAGDGASDVEPTTVPQPVAMVRTSWSTDPWALGSYSFLPVGASPDDRAALRASVDAALWFAGEALDPDNPATVHGAQASGRAAAEAIVEVAEPGERVVVVGAGMAGAAAARVLADAGLEVTVLEARDRTGGRVDTVQPDGWPVPVERGASWIHDITASDLAEQADALDVATVPFAYDDVVIDADGEELDPATIAEPAGAAVEEAVAWADEQSDVDVSLAAALDASGAADDLDPVALDHFVRAELVTEYGADADELSAWWTFEEGSEGDDLLVVGGYGRLVDALLEGIDVQLERSVVGIDRTGDAVRVVPHDGEPIVADRVVVTLPVGVLKAEGIAFDPPLPDAHRTAIDRLGVGLLDKVWLRFDEQWWTGDAEQWTRIAQGPDDAYLEWFDLAGATGEPVLLGLVGGAEARRWAERTDDEVLEAALASLQRFADAGR